MEAEQEMHVFPSRSLFRANPKPLKTHKTTKTPA